MVQLITHADLKNRQHVRLKTASETVSTEGARRYPDQG
jgi:hypothetical protein